MKAVRLHGVGDLRFENIAEPKSPEPDWVLVRVEAAGICGSDLHNYRTGQWISRAPSVAGHEIAGRILSIGEGVRGLTVGQPVVADSRFWCGECGQCRRGQSNACEALGFVGEICDGGFAEMLALPARLVLPRPSELGPKAAAMAEPLAVALHAIRRTAPAAGEPVLIVGCGTIGGLCALVLSCRHDGPIYLADRNAARAQTVARASGGQVVSLEPDALAEVTGSANMRFVIDATGSVTALEQIVGILAPNATLGLVGISHAKLNLDPNILVEREISLVGSHAFADELPEAIALALELEPVLLSLIDGTIHLEDVPAAFDRLIAGDVNGLKTIITMEQ